MLRRRVLPVAAAAATLVAIPSTAFATAPQAPVGNTFGASYYGYTDFPAAGGRQMYASLSEYRGPSQNGWSAQLTVSVSNDFSCFDDPSCVPFSAWGSATLTASQVSFSRNLDRASAVDVPMTLWIAPPPPPPSDPPSDGTGDPSADGSGDPSADGTGDPSADGTGDPAADGTGDPSSDGTGDDMPQPTPEQVTVSLTFTGTGAVARSSYKGTECGDGMGVCQSHRVGADRAATAELVVDGESASGPAHLSYVLGTDTAEPKSGPGGY